MDEFSINIFKSKYDNRVRPLPVTWDVFVQWITEEHQLVEDKAAALSFNAVEYIKPQDIEDDSDRKLLDRDTSLWVTRRRVDNVSKVNLLVLDFDGTLSIQDARARFTEYEHVGYTSYSHLLDGKTEKFRIVLPLVSPIPAHRGGHSAHSNRGDWYFLESALLEFASDADPVLLNPNQIYFLPSVHPSRRSLAQTWHNKGNRVDWTSFKRDEGQQIQSSGSLSRALSTTARQDLVIKADEVLQTSKGPIRAGDIDTKIEGVVCPFHDDKNGTEFVNHNPASGSTWLYCRKCNITVYVERTDDVISDFVRARRHKISTDKQQGEDTSLDYLEARRQRAQEKLRWAEREKRQASKSDELLALSQQKVYIDGADRDPIIRALGEIREQILSDARSSWKKTHILYLPEGAGKSRLALNLARLGQKILFATKSWAQAFEKCAEFNQVGLPLGIRTQLLLSKEAKLRRNFGTRAVRGRPTNPYDIGQVKNDATLARLVENNPTKSADLLRLTFDVFLSDDRFRAEDERHPDFNFATGKIIDEGDSTTYVGSTADIVITTIAQARILSEKFQRVPRDWVVWFDDPDVDDVIDIEPYDPDRGRELKAEDLERRTDQINGTRYFRRLEEQQLGRAFRSHLCVYTTTEQVTLRALEHMLRSRKEKFVLHDEMSNISGGLVTILGSKRVRRRYDAFVPLMARRLNKDGHKCRLIADGLATEFNHSNSKGQNALTDADLLVEISVPHPQQIRTICDGLGYNFKVKSREVRRLLMLDRMHQAIGRNSGFRHSGYQCVVLTDPNAHRYLITEARYEISEPNSVLVDRTKKMSSRERRTAESASQLVRDVETFLNDIHRYVADNRKVKPDIRYVLSQIDDESKRLSYVARLLSALTSMSGVRFDEKVDSSMVPTPVERLYGDLGRWVLKQEVYAIHREQVIKEYVELVDTDGGDDDG